ncbi:FYDLN acid domain-containing protein [Sphingomicrobium sp. XHP0235]|uniref:FYDLN acid domain-containing protein n=1 Tax=Sphingomicrobium aquimarinum TaxID=3133971 RepID=UPI0031FE7395
MVKPEWGTKRTCPKCSTRFYDLGNEEPVTCIECGEEWIPEPVLKSKQPLPFDDADTKKKDEDLAGDDLDVDEDDDGGSADDDVDLDTGDADIKVSKDDDETDDN